MKSLRSLLVPTVVLALLSASALADPEIATIAVSEITPGMRGYGLTVFRGTEPERFDVRRDPNPHVGFGGPGPHFCLGAHLARRELSVAFRQLFTRLPDIEVVGEPVLLDAMGVPLVGGIKRLPVRFTPTGRVGAV